MKSFHPKTNDAGQPVPIGTPSRATELSTWSDRTLVAVATPGCPMPPSINGIPVGRATRPMGPDGWEKLVVERTALTAPPLENPGRKNCSAGAVIREPDGRVWLFEPTNGYGGYVRTFPKGTREPGYSLAATAAKEVFEETGLLIEIGPRLVDTDRTLSVCRYFLGRRIGGDPSEMGWEAQAVCLVPEALLGKMAPASNDIRVLAALSSSTCPRWRE